MNPETLEDLGKETTSSVELTYHFPKLKNALISRLTIKVGDDRVIYARVNEN